MEVRGQSVGQACETLLRVCAAEGYATVALKPSEFRIAKTFRPRWATVMSVILAPIGLLGLLFLLVKRTEMCSISLHEDRHGVYGLLTGEVNATLWRSLTSSLWNTDAASERPSAPSEAVWDRLGSVAGGFAPTVPPSSGLNSAPAPASSLFEPPFRRADGAPPSPTSPSLPPPGRGWDDVDERTVTVAHLREMRPVTRVLSLSTPSGERYRLAPGLVIGREPIDDPQRPGLHRLAIADRSVSKSHLTIAEDDGQAWVCDRHSTNGTTIEFDGQAIPCRPGERVRVFPGASIRIGDVVLQLREDVA